MNFKEFISGLLMMSTLYYKYIDVVVAIASDVRGTKRKASKRKFWVNPLNSEKNVESKEIIGI